eukprot:TRINITY_DN2374_c0_g1_i11.p1 TRINITY_DN2374_c0_g1~~TRINITY_DN2374_c0_g1_i11.p1  ORF type:complete len:321 (-),score=50.46 TRINITY_DN2374_c0_g1_i11:227-1189(-)
MDMDGKNVRPKVETEDHGTTLSIFSIPLLRLNRTNHRFVSMLNEEGAIKAGRYRIPFKTVFPRDIPPSFKASHGKVEYNIKATLVSTKLLKFNKHATLPVTVLSDHPPYQLRPPLVLTQYSAKGRNHKIVMTVQLINNRFEIGKIPSHPNLLIKLDNQSNTPITHLRVRIATKNCIFYEKAPRCSSEVEKSSWTVVDTVINHASRGFPLQPSAVLVTKVGIKIPSDVVPSLRKSSSRLIDITYCLDVKAFADGFQSSWFSGNNEVKLELPVVLAHTLPTGSSNDPKQVQMAGCPPHQASNLKKPTPNKPPTSTSLPAQQA